MLAVFITCFLLTLAYALLMQLYHYGWREQKEFVASKAQPTTRISIIIPARDEARNIGACINSILAQQYPKSLFEVIVVDDHSEDNTAGIVAACNEPNIRCISLADFVANDEVVNSYKKKALAVGIAQSSGELIMTTDADCTADALWLRNVAAYYERYKPVMIAAPVDLTCDGSMLQMFQSIDFMSMQGITAAAQRLKMGNMANGANLAFTRAAYNAVNGYTGTEHLASGDDYLMMVKMHTAYPGRIAYLKSKAAIVRTEPQLSWRGFLQQRIRWASKSGKYKDNKLTAILGLVYLFNLAIFIMAVAGLFNSLLFDIAGVMLFWKILSELLFLFPVATFFNKRNQLVYFVLLQPLHVIYIVLAGFLGFVGVYKWKGRSVR